MQDKVLQLEAASPERLEEAIAGIVEEGGIKNHFVALSISGPKVIVRQIELPSLPSRELKKSLGLEAAELLSLPPQEAALDYQILGSADNRINGVFVALPREILEQYYQKIIQAKAIPLSITAQILTIISAFLREAKPASNSFSLLNFSGKDTVHLALFNAGSCELLREIRYDNIKEAKEEVFNSLRYALGRSSSKHPEEFYFSGDLTDKNELIASLENEFSLKGKIIDLKSVDAQFQGTKDYFKINLIKKYSLPFLFRNEIFRGLNIIIGISLLFCLVMAFKIIKTDKLIKGSEKELSSITKKIDYNYINSLQEKINLFLNEK